ncbi:acetyl-CoA carboxylase biotin carboxyl carrier protein [Phaeodactylibacter sp.]|jgi:acetyl-CoA carboxylase biotin carboxyl carrier protein|uniref:acetyl-CoA carboxylase biotin carboxyl carrier protein n=1 Tax=Phaeodactylibacter sp. TaxID=1940289 RepID=UPI0025E664C1|nr:acetyl-CoA carboxylase biotin carboxyl carrier protein [Phaeodactylibacter sp.]MCI4648177.1 acetyl-CoA carboxylase biotin carboxyl carrier protein [Phaeodactylibacter sp.]MCI5091968.1 acetyl-CoA carboxylase biotin carboxyl carrier protein [Phaeodactylibacter sp.]
MTFKDIQELVKLINKSNLTEFKMKDGEFELSIRTNKHQKAKPKDQASGTVPAPSAPQPTAPIIQMSPPVQQPYPQAPQPAPAPPAPKPQAEPAQSEAPASEAKAEDSNYLEVRSPIVGTFYRSSSPEKPPYVKVGDAIEVGQVVCIVEAMKLFNEIESEIAGKIVKVMVEDAQPVEYDQVLFLVDPKG